jgi:carboxylesterase
LETRVPEPDVPAVIPGAEPFFHEGSRVGVLVLHGFTGNPVTMKSLADAFVAAGFTVSMPRLPGHGTTVEDMARTSWSDWSAHVDDTYVHLAARCEQVVVASLSMGSTLACWLAARHPEIAGLVLVNSAVKPYDPGSDDFIQAMIDAGDEFVDGIGSDIADPDAHEPAYAKTPLRALLTLMQAIIDLQDDLPRITSPALVIQSAQDHVVDPTAADLLAEKLAGPVERITLERSFHVATMDYDKDLIAERAVEFARKVTSAS